MQLLREGDSLYHGKGVCYACHGTEGEGLPSAGPAITRRLVYAQVDWRRIDSLITVGIPNTVSAAPIAMPPRGARSDLTDEEIFRISAYVWAISQVRGEPWPGGHRDHAAMVPVGSTQGTATRSIPPETVP
ncbi:MAG: c-type cytochrome [Gemmatimonadales bacterium]